MTELSWRMTSQIRVTALKQLASCFSERIGETEGGREKWWGGALFKAPFAFQLCSYQVHEKE